MTGRAWGRRLRQVAVVAVVCGWFVASEPPLALAYEAGPPDVIYDADMDWDDAATLAYLAEEHKLGHINLRALTVTNDGAGIPGRAIRHARCLLQRLGLPDVPVADGSNVGVNVYPTAMRESIDRVVSDLVPNCTASDQPSPMSAPQLIRQVIATSPTAQIIVTGSLGNVAAAAPGGAVRVTVMGGAVRVPGNLCCGTPPEFDDTQEFNFWVDPVASRAALRAHPGQLRLVSLDATNQAPITPEFAARLRTDANTPSAQVVSEIVTHPEVAPQLPTGELSWWDPVAAMSALHPGIVDFEEGDLDVVTGGPSAGRTVLTRTGQRQEFGTAANAVAFERCFIDTLNHRSTCP